MSKSYKQVAPNGAYLLFADVKVTNLTDLISTSYFYKELFCALFPLGLGLVEDIGVEPMTLCVQGRCSSQLS
jgi:hypothetical protein